tara:strand:+ start:567 stop:1034 length:468 start_codon:yes stop_codon:yes gene_type:complete
MRNLTDEDWACFLDHDAMFTTTTWYQNIERAIKNTDYGLVYCMTNRINPVVQKFKSVDEDNHDIRYHRKIGKTAQEKYGAEIIPYDMTDYLPSGVCIIISQQAWKSTPYGFKNGFLSVDNDIAKQCKDCGVKVGLMRGLYVYHWYRGDGDKSHTI